MSPTASSFADGTEDLALGVVMPGKHHVARLARPGAVDVAAGRVVGGLPFGEALARRARPPPSLHRRWEYPGRWPGSRDGRARQSAEVHLLAAWSASPVFAGRRFTSDGDAVAWQCRPGAGNRGGGTGVAVARGGRRGGDVAAASEQQHNDKGQAQHSG